MLPGRVIGIACCHEIRIDHFVEQPPHYACRGSGIDVSDTLESSWVIFVSLKHIKGRLNDLECQFSMALALGASELHAE
jgi:hypothetical protein